jgi:hypothetical protein
LFAKVHFFVKLGRTLAKNNQEISLLYVNWNKSGTKTIKELIA